MKKILAIICVVALGGCVVAPTPGYYNGYSNSGVIVPAPVVVGGCYYGCWGRGYYGYYGFHGYRR